MNMTISTDAAGRFVRTPVRLARCLGKNFIVKNTTQYSFEQTSGGLILPGSKPDIAEKKYSLGEVVSIGPECDGLEVGDVVLYQTVMAFRVPNGQDETEYYRLHLTDLHVIYVLPNLDATKLNPSWKKHPHIKDLTPEIAQWKTGKEKPKS